MKSQHSGKFYITTSIPYVNSKPHVGFAMELVHCDFLARYHRLHGNETYFLTGTDEHGVKIAEVAEKEGISAQKLTDKYSAEFARLAQEMKATNDDFVRTTQERHIHFVQELWQKLAAAGDIYKSKYQGLYCVGCERFLPEKELVDGKCPIHQTVPKVVEEENYFFRLSRYAQKIQDLIEKDEVKIWPESKKNELLNLMKEGVEDVSFSRSKEAYKWGIPVPGDENQLMYVWCDALPNYLSVIDQEKFWPADVHAIGKDILRFHALVWVGMLLSANYALPKNIMVHGFITSDGQKMSKSLGNVVNPFDYIEKYGYEALRFFLLREIPTLDDGDFSAARFGIVYSEDMANTIGNLVSRVLAMSKKYFSGKVEKLEVDARWQDLVSRIWQQYHQSVSNFDFKKALEQVLDLAREANKYVEDEKPWVLAKEDTVKLQKVIYNLLEVIRHLALMLLPVLPDKAEAILRVFYAEAAAHNWLGRQKFGELVEIELKEDLAILFPRLEV